MRYAALDLETTGLDPSRDQVLMVAMVAEDTEKPSAPIDTLPTFACLVRHPRYEGDGAALAMNAELLKFLDTVADGRPATFRCAGFDNDIPVYDSSSWPAGHFWETEAHRWLDDNFPAGHRVVAAGKNVAGFDLQFFTPELRKRFSACVIDPGSVFVDWAKGPLPMDVLMRRLGLEEDAPASDPGVLRLAHDAIADARDVIRVLRKAYCRPFSPT
jgi:hypothetical protein